MSTPGPAGAAASSPHPRAAGPGHPELEPNPECLTCGGSGEVTINLTWDLNPAFDKPRTCADCGGTGQLWLDDEQDDDDLVLYEPDDDGQPPSRDVVNVETGDVL